MIFSKKEIEIIYNKDLLITKTVVISKMHKLFESVKSSLNESINKSDFIFPAEVDIKYGKIFRGENYQMLPFVNLDYPKYFKGNDIFTFRTMFLWGSFFSSTLHLSGNYLTVFRNNLLLNLNNYLDKDFYICINESPWHYHYGVDNYIKLTKDNLKLIETLPFVKLNEKFELNDYNKLPKLAAKFLDNCIQIIS